MSDHVFSEFETKIGECALELFKESVDQALADVDLTKIDTTELDAWFFAKVNTMVNEPKRQKHWTEVILAYAASFVALAIITSALVLAVSEPARAAFIRFIVERFPQYSEYFIIGEEDAEFVPIKPEYIPEGFAEAISTDTDEDRLISWINADTGQFITYLQTTGESSTELDTEDAEIRSEVVNGQAIEVIIKGNNTTMQFFRNSACYVIATDISYQECLKVTESLFK